MVIFGSMYYIVPRLIGREWRYASLIKLHFWASAYGIGLMTLMLLAGGFLQGSSMEDPSLAFSESVESVLPYLRGRSLARHHGVRAGAAGDCRRQRAERVERRAEWDHAADVDAAESGLEPAHAT